MKLKMIQDRCINADFIIEIGKIIDDFKISNKNDLGTMIASKELTGNWVFIVDIANKPPIVFRNSNKEQLEKERENLIKYIEKD